MYVEIVRTTNGSNNSRYCVRSVRSTSGVASLGGKHLLRARVFLVLLSQREIRDCSLSRVLPTGVEPITFESLVGKF